MMSTRSLPMFLSVSFAGHAVVVAACAVLHFSLASFPGPAAYKPAIYCGSILPESMFPLSAETRTLGAIERHAVVPDRPAIDAALSDYYLKPQAAVSCVTSRSPLALQAILADAPKYKDSAFTLHPLLPYQFDLYFKDRQAVHIELEFAVTHSDERAFVSLRRKISSGNLEADLLSMRYIGHYLYIQRARFEPSVWQNVKIEFSPHTQ